MYMCMYMHMCMYMCMYMSCDMCMLLLLLLLCMCNLHRTNETLHHLSFHRGEPAEGGAGPALCHLAMMQTFAPHGHVTCEKQKHITSERGKTATTFSRANTPLY